jgi:hypothetical protein
VLQFLSSVFFTLKFKKLKVKFTCKIYHYSKQTQTMPIVISKQQVREMYSNIKFEKNDCGMTWIHKKADMSPLNHDDIMEQMGIWTQVQETGEYYFECLEENYMELNTFDGRKWYIAVVQQLRPNGEVIDMDFCQMSCMLFGFLTKGFVCAFSTEKNRNMYGKFVRNINNVIEMLKTHPQDSDSFHAEFMERIVREEDQLQREREEERERLRVEAERLRVEAERLRVEAERLEIEKKKVRAEEAKTKLEAEEKAKKDAEELKKSLPKKKKEKKVKEAKIQVNPHKKDIRISEGIWKPNPAWKKWEQENKRSASPP